MVSITEESLSVAWAKAFLAVMKRGVREIAPMVVTVTAFENGSVEQTLGIEQALDKALEQNRPELTCRRVARTIFPKSLWNPAKPRHHLYSRYQRILPMIRRFRANRYGVYFERMIAFGDDSVNQLEHVLQTYERGNHRRSALQLSIFNPVRDHVHSQQRGFPCLQQVAFVPIASDKLCVTGFYPMQHLFDRAYGNYLGLCWLGQFVAEELGLELTRMECFAAVAALGHVNKGDLQPLVRTLETLL
jgi:thymidylate synthase